MRISHKHKLIGVSIPKCGSHSMFKLMEENFGAVPHGSFHGVDVPDNCKDFAAFTFVRNPYDRAISIYNMLSDPGDGSDFMRMINHQFYKQEVEDLEFETFCAWLGNCPEESMVYECSTSQYDHLRNSNITYLYAIKIDDHPLNNLNQSLYEEGLSGVYELKKEHENAHEDFDWLGNQICVDLINEWAKEDFKRYRYKKYASWNNWY